MEFVCPGCGFRCTEPVMRCPSCGSLMEVVHGFSWRIEYKEAGIWRFRHMLPETALKNSLWEGFTPVVRSAHIGRELEIEQLFFKDEGRNPTGSFRDRVAALITSHAGGIGVKKLICGTDGNTGASLAAYAARLGIKVIAYVPRNADYTKIMFMKSLGAEVIEVGETLDDVCSLVDTIARRDRLYNATSESNALSVEALKTIAFELHMDLGDIDAVVLPVGSGLTLYSIYYGYRELQEHGVVKSIPRIIGAVHCSSQLVLDAAGLGDKVCSEKPVIGLAYASPPFLNEITRVVKETGGLIVPITLREIHRAGEAIAKKEGLFIEPSAAAAIAALYKLKGEDPRLRRVAVIITGHGLKGYEQYVSIRKRERSRVFYKDTKTEIIRLLRDRDGIHGYAIWRELKTRVSLQAVYQHLRELEKKGIVYTRESEGRKLYYLTLKGRRIAELLDEISSLLI